MPTVSERASTVSAAALRTTFNAKYYYGGFQGHPKRDLSDNGHVTKDACSRSISMNARCDSHEDSGRSLSLHSVVP